MSHSLAMLGSHKLSGSHDLKEKASKHELPSMVQEEEESRNGQQS
jgi:hypothetical protein